MLLAGLCGMMMACGGQQDGQVIAYNADGKPSVEENFKEGKLHGKKIMYYDNGEKQMEEMYANGQLED